MKKILFITALLSTSIHAQDINLLCTDSDSLLTMTFSISKEKGKLVIREDSVTMKDREYDEFGGYTKIEETPINFIIEYTMKSSNFVQIIFLNRLNCILIQQYKEKGLVTSSKEYLCKSTKKQF